MSTSAANLITRLEEIQDVHGHLPEEALRQVSRETGRPLAEILGLASFYRSFSLEPRGRHQVSVCRGTACHVRRAPDIQAAFEQELGCTAGQTTPGGEFTLATVNCLGACALAPVVVAGGTVHRRVHRKQVKRILEGLRSERTRAPSPDDPRSIPLSATCPACGLDLSDQDQLLDGLPSIRLVIRDGDREGSLHLSAIHGSHATWSTLDVPVGTCASLDCPGCRTDLEAPSTCPACGSHRVALEVAGRGALLLCARRGCREHLLDIDGTFITWPSPTGGQGSRGGRR